jgi:hypothetical protein
MSVYSFINMRIRHRSYEMTDKSGLDSYYSTNIRYSRCIHRYTRISYFSFNDANFDCDRTVYKKLISSCSVIDATIDNSALLNESV